MIPLCVNPNAVILVDTKGEVIAVASNISPDFKVKIVHERSEYVAEANTRPFDSTIPPQPEQPLNHLFRHPNG